MFSNKRVSIKGNFLKRKFLKGKKQDITLLFGGEVEVVICLILLLNYLLVHLLYLSVDVN